MSEKELSKTGMPYENVLKMMQAYRQKDANWHDGKTFSLVYHASDEHTEFLKKAYELYFNENGLNPMAFPSLVKFEAEILAMAASIFGGDSKTAGTMTSGGSESIMMAIKTYRDRAKKLSPQIKEPEAILPISVHPAFEKACHYFGLKTVHIPVDSEFKADVKAIEAAINSNTILIVGSAPAYPHGVMDPIESMAKLALSRGLPLHVDACIGGFMLPFVKKLGYEVPNFDFSVPGVTSISADLHKYGFSAKGASVILYKDADLRRFQFFTYVGWTGGIFASPSMTGTRPGGSIAAAWAAMTALGESGYLAIHKKIMQSTEKLKKGITEISGLHIVGKPVAGIFAFGAKDVDILAVADQLEKKGWFLDRQQNPSSVHLTVAPTHEPFVDQYLKDLRDAVEVVRKNPALSTEGAAAMYGMMAKVPDPSMINDFLYNFMDQRYELDPKLPF